VIASIFSGLLNSALSGIASSFAQAANSFLAVLFRLLNASTSLSLSGASFITEFNAVFMIGLLVALALAMIELGAAALQRNGARVAKVPLNLLLMVAGTVASISLIDMLLTISDQVSTGLLQATGFSLSTTGMTAALAVAASQPGTELMLAIFIIIAVICCYFALVVRRVLIVVAAVMAPLALAGATAQATRSWVRRWTETILALVFSKVILVIVLITGFHLLQGAGATNIASAMASLIGGVGLLFIAAFSPLMAMKMVTFTGGHFAEAALLGHQAVSAAAAPVKKAADVGTAAATGGTSAAAGAALGVRLPGGASRTSAPGGATPSASSLSGRTPSAPAPVSAPAPAPSGASPTGGTTSSATPSRPSSAPSRTGATPSASAAHATPPPAGAPSSVPAAGPVDSGAVDAPISSTANAPVRVPADAAGGPVGPAMAPSASPPQASSAPDARPSAVDGPAAAIPPAAAGAGPSSSTQSPRPSTRAPYEGRVPPRSNGEEL
jgi:type IV secretion system protein TrbL